MPGSIAVSLSVSNASASPARSGLILTRPMTACIDRSLCAAPMNAHTWISVILGGPLVRVVMKPRWLPVAAGASANSPILWLTSGVTSRRERGGLGPSAQAELGQDARHVVLDRLA